MRSSSLHLQSEASVTSPLTSDVSPQHISPSRSSSARGWIICALALAAGIGANRLMHSRSTPAFPAYLQAQVTTIMADRQATVVAIAAAEGDHVSQGAALVSLRDRNLESRITQQQQNLALLETQLQQAMAAAELELMVRVHEIEDELLRADLGASNLLREQFACELEHSMLADLVADNSTAAIWNDSDPVYRSAVLDVHPQTGNEVQTALRLELIANSAEVLAAQVDMCDRRRESLEQLKSELPAMVRNSTGVQALETRITDAHLQLEQLEAEQLTLSVPSSAFGIVGLFRVNPGTAVEPGMPLVDILDDETRYLSAHISSRHIAEFAKGDAVDLIFPGGQRRTGVVERIAPQAQIDTLDPRKSEDSVVLVDIAPSGRYWPTLPIGSQVQVLVRE